MRPFNDQHRELLFDYSVGLTSETEGAEAERLLVESDEAARLYEALRSVLAPLDALEVEPCPEELAERTLLRLKEASRAASDADHPEERFAVAGVDDVPVRIPFWRNWGDIAAVAAVLVLLVGVVLPTLGFARQKYWQTRCQATLVGVHEGLAHYVAEHEGQLPSIETDVGEPWWKVGYQGLENHSNTRRAWILVREGYVLPDRFICPGRRSGGRISFDRLNVEEYSDFPHRSLIGYSVRISSPQSKDNRMMPRKVLMADLNPIAEELPTDYSAQVNLRLSENLLRSNSRNHGGRGQNVLFTDGSVQFLRRRHTNSSNDDIYTTEEMSNGCSIRGYERPSCETDAFLAP
jgi:prepilin-type processing-associated H-X9-DG protein